MNCKCIFINGVKCHELGCSEAWKDEVRNCRNCGETFQPSHINDQYCYDCECGGEEGDDYYDECQRESNEWT